MSPYAELIRRHSRPLTPQPTPAVPRLVPMPNVRAVLFDVYGTLIISASGDVGVQGWHALTPGEGRGDAQPRPAQTQGVPPDRAAALAGAFDELGLALRCPPADGVARFRETIVSHQAAVRARGVEHPEVDVVAVWRDVYPTIAAVGGRTPAAADVDYQRLAVAYEARVNPVWPMPHAAECLAALRAGGRRLGIVSNAQFFTLELFPALLGGSVDQLGFDPQWQYYSYQHGQAKPGRYLYRLAADRLAAEGIVAADVLYIGNDRCNDIWPALAVGFRTALFAGDARSLRLREDDPRLAAVEPDVVLTDLAQLPQLVAGDDPSSNQDDTTDAT